MGKHLKRKKQGIILKITLIKLVAHMILMRRTIRPDLVKFL